MAFCLAICPTRGRLTRNSVEVCIVNNRTIELLILFLIAFYILTFIAPGMFIALGNLVHIVLVAILILVLVRLLQGKSVR